MPNLSNRRVLTVKEPGFYGDGEGLYLSVKPSGSKSWILRTMVQGRRRDIGIGSASLVPLAEARSHARELRTIAREGGDPLASRAKKTLSLIGAAEEYHSIISPSFSSEKHRRLWLSGLQLHVFPKIGDYPIQNLTTGDVRKALEPIWTNKHETARRIKQRLEAIFDWAKAEGHFVGDNPCSAVKRILKPQRHNPTHHPAMPWQALPEFYASLKSRDSFPRGHYNSLYSQQAVRVKSVKRLGVRWISWSGLSQVRGRKLGGRIVFR